MTCKMMNFAFSASASCMLVSVQPNTKTCQCNKGTTFAGSSCAISAVQCPPSTVFISSNFCQDLVQIGQFCTYTVQCMGYSVCYRQRCTCPVGFAEVRNVCRRQRWSLSLSKNSSLIFEILPLFQSEKLKNVWSRTMVVYEISVLASYTHCKCGE